MVEGAAMPKIAPLLGRREPLPGESLMSVIVRACWASGFPSLPRVLGSIGMSAVPEFVPFSHVDRADDLAALLRIDPEAVLARMHPGGREVIDWWGEPVRRMFVEAKARRFSPASLRLSAHHRAAWMIRALPFCPESFELLRSDCPSCGKTLGWRKTAGIDRCEHCQTSLAEGDAEEVNVHHREAASRIAALVSVDPVERREAVRSFEAPFDTWRPGDVFEAIVELGVALENLQTVGVIAGEMPMGDGRYERITTQVPIAGLDVLDRWPASLTEIVDRVAMSTNDAGSTALADCLGPLNKFIQRHRSGFPLADAMAAELASAFRAARVPVKSTALTRFAPPEDDGLISEKEALESFDVYQTKLRRLDGRSDTLVIRRASVSKLYDRAALANAVQALRSSVAPAEVLTNLGLPEFVLEAFDQHRLLELQTNADALLMSGADHLVTQKSIRALVERVGALRLPAGDGLQPMSSVLRHIFSPEAWALAMEVALGDDRSALRPGEEPMIDRLMVEPDFIHHVLHRQSWTFPGDVGVSCILAGRLIGQNDVLLSKAVAEGVLDSWKGPKRSHMIRLSDLFDFDQTFAFTNDIAERLGCSPQGAAKQMRNAGLGPSRHVFRMALWNRSDVDAALGLKPKPQHQIVQSARPDSSMPLVRRSENKLARRGGGSAVLDRGAAPLDLSSCPA
ncbi:MAG: hypothetical protein EON59_07225 [Alphaproteobacteria bacterium]|nr:MAG: hypothetical protein EON59_07225 [Alphaproteobacteria bacterium]